MKVIKLENVDNRVLEALQQQRREDPILLTKGSDALGLLLRLPEGTKDSDVDGVFWLDGPTGRTWIIIEAKQSMPPGGEDEVGHPVFGNCKGMLSVVVEDDEHLKVFGEYMR
jgi:hypothetical protein